MVLTILMIVYRNVVAMLLPLATIGVSLVVAQQVVAALGLVGLPLGPQTLVLMTGMMLGAGTDYAVFLFSRYHECVRTGLSSDDALKAALGSIGGVVMGSAATVAITFFGLAFTDLGIFQTIGPALTVTIAIGFLAAVTMLPALIVLAGRRGWIKPRKDMTGRFWRRSGIQIARRPKVHLAVSLVILISLAATVSLVKFNYDDRKTLPADAASNRGYAAMDAHFPVASTLQQFLLVKAPNVDLRTPKSLADLEQLAHRVSSLPGIQLVRGITRPSGDVLEQAKTSYQVGQVGDKLLDGSTQISAGRLGPVAAERWSAPTRRRARRRAGTGGQLGRFDSRTGHARCRTWRPSSVDPPRSSRSTARPPWWPTCRCSATSSTRTSPGSRGSTRGRRRSSPPSTPVRCATSIPGARSPAMTSTTS